jgi:hypothetical protein
MRTLLINDKRKTPVEVKELDGTVVRTLEPQESFVVETDDPTALLYPFQEVRFVDGPPFAYVKYRPDYEPPKYAYPCTFLCVGGQYPVGYVNLHDRPICLMRGVPTLVGLSLLDSYVVYDSVRVGVPVLRRRPSEKFDGIVSVHWELTEEPHSRSQEELEKIQAAIERLGTKEEE